MSFFVSADCVCGSEIIFPPEESKHLSLVLRMKPGQTLSVCDDEEHRHLCRLTDVGKSCVRAEIISTEAYSNQPSCAVTVYAALSKGDRFDYTIQKCVECGVFAIAPFISERCIARPDKSDYEKKQARFQKIADEAVRQSGRSKKVKVLPIMSYEEALLSAKTHKTAMFLYENENKVSLSLVLSASDKSDYAIISGPEGGFSENEAETAQKLGIPVVSIGPRILRCETAPVAALCSVMFYTGNFDIGE